MMNYAAKNGAFIGAGLVLTYMLTHIIQGSLHTASDFSGNVNAILLIAGIIVFTKKYRNTKTYLSYSEAFKVGFLTAAFASFIGSFFLYLYYSFIEPGAVEKYLILQQNVFLASGMQEEQAGQMTELMKGMISPGMLAFSSFFGNMIFGLIVSLVAAVFLKKGNSNPDAFSKTMSQIDEEK